MAGIPCPFDSCSEVKIGRSQLVYHLKFEHTATAQRIQCKLPECNRTCSSVQAYEKHLYHWHFYDGETSMCDDEDVNYDYLQESQHSSSENCAENTHKSCTGNLKSSKDAFTNEMILFCLKLRDKYVLSNQSHLSIMNDMVAIFSKFHADLIDVYKQFSEDSMPSTCKYFTDKNFFHDSWSKLQNESLFTDCCKSIGFVEPTTFRLSNGGNGGTYWLIPICEHIEELGGIFKP